MKNRDGGWGGGGGGENSERSLKWGGGRIIDEPLLKQPKKGVDKVRNCS